MLDNQTLIEGELDIGSFIIPYQGYLSGTVRQPTLVNIEIPEEQEYEMDYTLIRDVLRLVDPSLTLEKLIAERHFIAPINEQ